jgi:hypothetical protein
MPLDEWRGKPLSASQGVATAPTKEGYYWAQDGEGDWELVLLRRDNKPASWFWDGHPKMVIVQMGMDDAIHLHCYVKFVRANLITPDGKEYDL